MKLKSYRQREGEEKIVEGWFMDIETAINAVKDLKVSRPESEIPEMIGFQRKNAFIEFTRISDKEFQVRDENHEKDVYLIGTVSEQKAIDCLIDFFEGDDLRWSDELEEY